MSTPVVLCVRHPDYDNEYIVSHGPVKIIDIDLGRTFDSEPESFEQWQDWYEPIWEEVKDLSPKLKVRKEVERIIEELKPDREAIPQLSQEIEWI